MTTAETQPTTSVVIVGAGPVGMFLALKLGRAGIDVTVVEKDAEFHDAPRACGYFAASALAMHDAGVWDTIRAEGFVIKGLCWRKKPTDDGTGSGDTKLGSIIAAQPLADLADDTMPPGTGILCLQQYLLTRVFARAALATGQVKLLFGRALTGIQDDGTTVTAETLDAATGATHRITASVLVGADGGRSTTRKLLNIPFPGHTWPERLLATNVTVRNTEDPIYHCYYLLDPRHCAVITPLTDPAMGQPSLWRYTLAIDPGDTRTDEELLQDESIASLYGEVMPTAQFSEYTIQARSVYRIHQRLASTMRRGRCLLAGDAAHLCNPFGALGLNTGVLDADALGDALIMVLNENQPVDAVLDTYSDERRKVFQFFIDPTSTANKLRVQNNHQDTAVDNDWYFRLLQSPTEQVLKEQAQPYFDVWRTDMRKAVKGKV
ncbi:hypothetical protein SEUCBS139899_006127 [Sporothrix eucalyptigena]|uniref:FAD-binding domain-containing protein n=1 Tax=Sporothrix eucalyptigena TaxID=1812306 RepID=A0ABP0CCT8_9PEZI